jgi:hypothetical protein
MRLYVSFKASDFNRYVAALGRMTTDVPLIADSMCRYGAIEYKTEVIRAIITGNFATRVPRLTEKYLEWKKAHSFPSGIGRLKDDLISSIGTYEIATGWFSGVDPIGFDTGGKNWGLSGPSKLISKYAVWLEEGNREGEPDRQKPRRIFMPIARRYAKTGYPKQFDKAARRLEQKWH